MHEFSQCEVEQVEKTLKTSAQNGLTSGEAQRRLALMGKNRLLPDHSVSFGRFLSLLSRKLSIFFMIFSLVLSSFFLPLYCTLTVSILFLLYLAVLFFVYSYREKGYQSLAAASLPYVCVIRDGKQIRVSPEELVVGDLMKISVGDILYADAYIVSEKNVEAVCKRADVRETYIKHGGACYEDGEPRNLLFFGDVLRAGDCYAFVIDTAHELIKNEWNSMSVSEKSQNRLCRMSARLSLALGGISLLFAFFFVRETVVLSKILLCVSVIVAISPATWSDFLFDSLFLSRNRKMFLKHGALWASMQAAENVSRGNCYLLPARSVLRGSKYVVRFFESGTGIRISETSSHNTAELSLISSLLLKLREKYAVPFSEKHFTAFCKRHMSDSYRFEIDAMAFSNEYKGMSIAAVRNFSDGRAFSFVGADPEDLLPYAASISEKGRTRLLDKQTKETMLSSIRKLKKEGYELIAYAETQTRFHSDVFPSLAADMKLLGFFVLAELSDSKIEFALEKISKEKNKAFFFHNGEDPSLIKESVPLLKDAVIIDAFEEGLTEKLLTYISSSDEPFAIGLHFSPSDQSKLAHLLEDVGHTVVAYGNSFSDHRLMCASSVAITSHKNAGKDTVGMVHTCADAYATEHIASQTACVSEAKTVIRSFDVATAYFCASLLARSVILLCGVLFGVFLLTPISLAILSFGFDFMAYVFLSRVVSRCEAPDLLSARNRDLGLFLGSFLGSFSIAVLSIFILRFPAIFPFGIATFVFLSLIMMLNVGVFCFASAHVSVYSVLFALLSVFAVAISVLLDFFQNGAAFSAVMPFWALIPTVVLVATGRITELIFNSKNNNYKGDSL